MSDRSNKSSQPHYLIGGYAGRQHISAAFDKSKTGTHGGTDEQAVEFVAIFFVPHKEEHGQQFGCFFNRPGKDSINRLIGQFYVAIQYQREDNGAYIYAQRLFRLH